MIRRSKTGLATTRWSGPLLFLLALSVPAVAQQPAPEFSDAVAIEELDQISKRLDDGETDPRVLSADSVSTIRIESRGLACVSERTSAITRLESRLEPLQTVDGDTATPEMMEQLRAVQEELNRVRQERAVCEQIVESASNLQDRIISLQTELSQRFLTLRSTNIFRLILDFPERAARIPENLRESLALEFREGFKSVHVFWLLIGFGVLATIAGLFARFRFTRWYEAAGGDDTAPRVLYLLPKPVAEFAPLLLVGLTFVGVLYASIQSPSEDLLLIRVAWAVVAYGVFCVIVSWSTGPLSPSNRVEGLIPDHVKPVRLRLRLLFLAVCFGYAVLGFEWMTVRIEEVYVPGRAPVILLVTIAMLALLNYLPRIPGVKGQYRALRFAAMVVTGLAAVAVLLGYQNFAAYVTNGVIRTGIALFLMWILLWLVYSLFEYLREDESATADKVRASLGMSKRGTGTGIGFMRLIVDLVLWFSFAVFMIDVWDESGATIGTLYERWLAGFQIGGIDFRPVKILRGILLFIGVIIAIGWLKRWIDRRWLRDIVTDRGARDAILTLFGYVGFVIAILFALSVAEVNLTGLALISGALALGIGFGMQEIASNFVSGLILLFERPIRAGDFVTVGDIQGFVRSIRIRATEIETLDNQNVLVPNSELVSGRVTNWVLRDSHGRLLVSVGVAYGSDVEKVRDILEQVARDHSEVITDGTAPAPRALFMGFGDSSLDFELRVRVKRIERRFQVRSDLNFEIDKAFREANVTIPFPQRDLHVISTPAGSKASDAVAPLVETSSAPAQEITRSHHEQLIVNAPIEDVWAAITDESQSENWMTTDGVFEARLGGEYETSLRGQFQVSGRVDVFMPPRRMRIILPSVRGEEPFATGPITVEFLLTESDEQTTLDMSITGIPASEDWELFYRLSVDKWREGLTELKSLLRNRES